MLLVIPTLILANTAGSVDASVLQYHAGIFTVVQGKSKELVSIDPTANTPPPSMVTFRRDDNYAVWDSRGLTIRHGDKSSTTLLDEAPTSSRLFPHDVLVETVADLASGKKQRPASALSGAMRIGSDAYFLARWEDSSGKPWMEVLVRVSLGGTSLKPEVLGRFDAISLGYKPIDARLGLVGSQLMIVGRQGKTWGVASYDTASSKFNFRPLGDDLISYMATTSKTGLFVERTPYGSTLGGKVDLAAGYRKPLFEARGSGRFVDALRPTVFLFTREGETRIGNGETAAITPITSGSGVARVGSSVLVWSPVTKPTSATLFDSERWTVLSKWSSP